MTGPRVITAAVLTERSIRRVIAEVLDAEAHLDRATDIIADRLAVLAITGEQLVRFCK